MKAGAFPVWVSSLLVYLLVCYALLLALVQFLVPELSLHWVAPLSSYLAGQVVHWVESPLLGYQGLDMPMVFVLPHSSLVHRWC